MNKNGFVFVETIVAIAILTSSLLLLYSSFNKVLQSEKTRVYYDDIAYIYRTQYLNRELNKLNINYVFNDIDSMTDSYQKKNFVVIGPGYEALFLNNNLTQNHFENMYNNYGVKQMVMIKENKLTKLKNCNEECSSNSNCENYELCNRLYISLNKDFINYLKTIFVDISCEYVLLVEYENCDSANKSCQKYYAWIGV